MRYIILPQTTGEQQEQLPEQVSFASAIDPAQTTQKQQNNSSLSKVQSIQSIDAIKSKGNQGGSFYDVKAEGSIINIKRNSHGDPEMLILSSQKELQDLMNTKISNMRI